MIFLHLQKKIKKKNQQKCLIENIQMKEEGELILIRITGSHFLWKMVRRMTGILAEIGRGNMSGNDLKALLKP